MNKSNRKRWTISLGILLILLFSSIVSAQGNSEVRFVHVVPGAPLVDIYTNGEQTISGLAFGEASNYIDVPAGTHQITVTANGETTPLWQQEITVGDDSIQTLIASSDDNPTFVAYEDNLNPVAFGDARFLLIHAIADGPSIDVILNNDGSTIATDVTYGQSFGTFDIPAGIYDMAFVPAGGDVNNAIVPSLELPLVGGESNIAIVYGTPDAPAGTLLTYPVDAEGDFGLVSFAHAVVGAPAVDVLINDTQMIPQLSVGDPSNHIALPAGDHNVALAVGGETVLTTDLTIASGDTLTVVAIGTLESFNLVQFPDDLSAVTNDTTTLRVINTVQDSANLSVTSADGTIIGNGLSAGEASDPINIPASNQALQISLEVGGEAGTIDIPATSLYDGAYYNAIVIGGDAFNSPSLALASTSVSQSIASAPGSQTITVATADTSEVSENQEDATDTTTSESQPPAPTEEPVVELPVDEETVAFARVLLDPGASLNLRQYPTTDALVLASIPSGTSLGVRGREGAPEPIEGVPTPLDEVEFIDPADLLTEDDTDIEPISVWLNVIFDTEDGGEITGWVNANFVDVRDARGDLQNLVELPTVPRNFFGVARETTIASPTEQPRFATAVVEGIDAGAALNIRRTPSAESEVLDRISNDTVMQFLGINSDEDWAFVEYRPEGGGAVLGWVSADFVRYEYLGNPTNTQVLLTEGLIETFEDRRGEITAGTATSTGSDGSTDTVRDAVVAEVVLDPGASLHLRRDPSTDAESLNLIPSGETVVVDRRTEDGAWLRTNYDGTTGWIASFYVTLTFNGTPIAVENAGLEVDTDVNSVPPEIAETTETPPEPEATEEPSS